MFNDQQNIKYGTLQTEQPTISENQGNPERVFLHPDNLDPNYISMVMWNYSQEVIHTNISQELCPHVE